jgi:hypothetical protein
MLRRKTFLGFWGCWMLGTIYCIDHPELLPVTPTK